MVSYAATTHCFAITGQGIFKDPRFLVSSPVINIPEFGKNCVRFETWDDLYTYFKSKNYTFEDQFFITQLVHGVPGGRALDNLSKILDLSQVSENSTIDDLGGTSPEKIINILESIASDHRVGYHNMSCHGGSLLTRYIQQLDESDSTDEKQARLCIVTDSNQGRDTDLRSGIVTLRSGIKELEPKYNLHTLKTINGLSMSDLFKMEIEMSYNPEKESVIAPVFSGLISSAIMSVVPEHKNIISKWEGEQYPMVIHHPAINEKEWTGAYQTCPIAPLLNYPKSSPIWGPDVKMEQVYGGLIKNGEQGWDNPGPLGISAVHKASVESLKLPARTEGQRLRRQACDEFIF